MTILLQNPREFYCFMKIHTSGILYSHSELFSAIIHYHRCINLHLVTPNHASKEYSVQPAEYSYPFEGLHMHCRIVRYSKNQDISAHLKPDEKKNKKIILCVFSLISPKLYARAGVKHTIYFKWPYYCSPLSPGSTPRVSVKLHYMDCVIYILF